MATEKKQAGKSQAEEQERAGQRSGRGGGSDSSSSDLKQREYRDKDGNIHHHTRTYMEQHKGQK